MENMKRVLLRTKIQFYKNSGQQQHTHSGLMAKSNTFLKSEYQCLYQSAGTRVHKIILNSLVKGY